MDTVSQTVQEDAYPVRRILELCALLQIALFCRYIIYRSSGGRIPIHIGEFEELARFILSEAGGWAVLPWAMDYSTERGMGHCTRPGSILRAISRR